jgi:hypothetical protein
MPKYEVKVTASWWVDVEADNKEEAEQIAHTTYYEGSYDGVDDIEVHEVEEESDEEE